MTTLLEQLDEAETRLIQAEYVLAARNRDADALFAMGHPHDRDKIVLPAQVAVMAAAAHAQITAARCLATTEDIADGPMPDRVFIDEPVSLANAPAPRPRDHEPAWCCESGRLAAPHPCPWHSGDMDPPAGDDVDQALEQHHRIGRFLKAPLDVAFEYGHLWTPTATNHPGPVASHGVEEGRFGVIHWHNEHVPALRLDLHEDPIR